MSDQPTNYREIFEVRGSRYDEAMLRWPAARDEEFGFILSLAEPQPGETVIDIPSGGGYLAAHMPEGVSLLAVETSEVFASRGRERGTAVHSSSLLAPDVPAGTAHAVMSLAGIHHQENQPELFEAWHRLLKPAGRMVIADVIEGSPQALFLDGFVHENTTTGHDGFYLREDLALVVGQAGFRDVQTVDSNYHWWAETREDLAEFTMALFGLSDVEVPTVIEALETGPGIDEEADRVGLCWGLRGVTGFAA